MKKLIIFIILVLFTSCIFLEKMAIYDDVAMRPVKPRYTLSKKEFTLLNDSIIDINSIYYSAEYNHFIRFFSNGRCIWRYGNKNKEEITYDIANDFNRGSCGYYVLEGNKLKIEFFWKQSFYHYVLMKTEIKNETFSFDKLYFKSYYSNVYSLFPTKKKEDTTFSYGNYKRIKAIDLNGSLGRTELKGKPDW